MQLSGIKLANSSKCLPCVLIIDDSFSMKGKKQELLTAALKKFKKDLLADQRTGNVVHLITVVYSSTPIISPMTNVQDWRVPDLQCNGYTVLAEAMDKSYETLINVMKDLVSQGVRVYNPWVFIFTDGVATDHEGNYPTDNWRPIAQKIAQLRLDWHIDDLCYAFAVLDNNDDQDMAKEVLTAFTNDSSRVSILANDDMQFGELFQWLSYEIKKSVLQGQTYKSAIAYQGKETPKT